MDLSITIIPYDSTELVLYERHRQNWLSYRQIGGALGMTINGIQKLFDRYQDRFSEQDTILLPLPTDSGMQETRVFSMRGTLRLALLSKTPEAERFRDFLVDHVINQDKRPRRFPPAPPRAVSTDTWVALRSVADWPDVPATVRTRLLEAAATGVGVPRPSELMVLAERRLAASLAAAPLMKTIGEIDREASAKGFSKDALKTEMQLLKRLRSQPQLPLENPDASEDDQDA